MIGVNVIIIKKVIFSLSKIFEIFQNLVWKSFIRTVEKWRNDEAKSIFEQFNLTNEIWKILQTNERF
jgi:hypothetical protein